MARSLIVTDRHSRIELNNPSHGQREGNALLDDETIEKQGGLAEVDLVKLLEGTQNEPRWRASADRCADYYDNNQLDSETLDLMRRRGVPAIIINLIHPTINTVLGMEARERTDTQVTFDEPMFEHVAIALNKKLSDFERGTNADRAVSNAYAGQVKAGLHWVEVGRNPNPFANSGYRCKDIHRREIWWDWSEGDPEDWRYLIRKRWIDADRLATVMPMHKDLIRYVSNRWQGWGRFAEDVSERTGLGQSYDIERAFTITENEWRDTDRRRLVTFEVWYRVWKRGLVGMLNNGKRIEIDLNNPRHAAAVAAGVLQPTYVAYPKMRQAFFIGPHRVIDRWSPLPHHGFPYTPFFGYREDLTRAPYGLIRVMLSPQDEVNARRSRLMALLGSRRMIIDNDALDTSYNSLEDAAEEVSRHDMVLVTDPKRRNRANAIDIKDNGDLSNGQIAMLHESKGEIQQASGVFGAMQGDSKNIGSRVILDGLVQQGTTTLAEINDNYQHSRREVFEQALAFIKADSMHEHAVGVGEGKGRKTILLNKPVYDESIGDTTLANSVAASDARVVLQEVPSSATYRQQQFAQLTELTKSLPPAIQAFVTPFVMEATDLKDRKQIASVIRKQIGMPEPGTEDAEDGQNMDPMQNPQIQALLQQYDGAINELTAKLEETIQTLETEKMKAADKSEANAIKQHEVDTKAALERERMAQQERHSQQAAEQQRDKEFLTGLQADADGNGEPDGKQLVGDILKELLPHLKRIEKRIDKVETRKKG